MENMNGWDLVLLVVAGYVATIALVRLMIRRREQMLSELRQRLKMEKKRKEEKESEQKATGRRTKAA